MTTYLDTQYGKIWVDDAIPCVFTSILRHLNSQEFNALIQQELVAARGLRRKSKVMYSVTDLTSYPALPKEMMQRYMEEAVQPEQVDGYLYKLFVKPEKKGAYVFSDVIDSFSFLPNLKAEVVNSFEGALNAINGLKVDGMAVSKPKTGGISGFLHRLNWIVGRA